MSQLMHATWGHGWHWSGQVWAPLADLRETDDAYVVEMDLPGLKKDDITVELSGNELVVTGDLKDGADGQSSHRIRRSGHVEQRGAVARLGRGGQGDRPVFRRGADGDGAEVRGPKTPSGRGHLRLSTTSARAAGTVPGRTPR
jgi:Hsp20/alpha crystallin family